MALRDYNIAALCNMKAAAPQVDLGHRAHLLLQ